jgi:HAD superfamily hydrolase (TIGR01484 family)
MRYQALATDYDGTIATHGVVDEATLAALERLRSSGRKLLLVTGRELGDLKTVFSHWDLFDWIVAENGALLLRPSNQEKILLAEPPSKQFVDELVRRGVAPMSVGDSIVATWHPHETTVLETIRDLGLELQVIFNKDAVMVLPSNCNKATGLTAALDRMGLSPHEVVGVGDAENDHAFLSLCECGAAVDNALPAVKDRADIVLTHGHGAGVTQLIERMLADDLKDLEGRVARHQLLLGKRRDGVDFHVTPYANNLLIAGPSGSGKSTVATAILERLGEHGYQFCVADPEGDFAEFEGAVVLGGGNNPPEIDEVMQLLKKPRSNAVVNLLGVPLSDRPTFFLSMLTRLLEMRGSVGRPHWILVDEAHHLLPKAWTPSAKSLPSELSRMILVTVHPEEVSPAALAEMRQVAAVGNAPDETIREFCRAINVEPPDLSSVSRSDGEVVVWTRPTESSAGSVEVIKPAPSHTERRRHIRKYAEGELPPDRSFFFRGPAGKLKLRAQNLLLFLQTADGVDDETWMFHLRQGDVSKWFTEAIKDKGLAEEAAAIEQNAALTPDEARVQVRAIVEKRYTAPATSRMPIAGTDSKPQFSGKSSR